MRLLVAGSAARLGVALATALHDRGHVVHVADRFHDAESRLAAEIWNRWHPDSSAFALEGPPLAELRPVVARQDALVIVGDPEDSGFDVDLTLAIADAAVALPRALPIVRLTALAADAGVEREAVRVVRGRAELRDFPDGIPIERTASALDEADRALRLVATMRDHACVLLRASECLAPGRIRFAAGELANAAALARALDLPSNPTAPETTLDLLDGATLATAVERAAQRAALLSGSILHVTGGGGARLAMRDVEHHLDLLHSPEPPLGAPEGAFADRAMLGAPEPAARAHLLDDAASRDALGLAEVTWAPRALERFHRFAASHALELAPDTPLFA